MSKRKPKGNPFDDPDITICMPEEDRQLVLRALRDPDNQWKQGIGFLYDGEGGYCCLGVAQCVKTGGMVEYPGNPDSYVDPMPSLSLPTINWLDSVGWEFRDASGNPGVNPYFPSIDSTAADANDELYFGFAQIADLWEKHSVGY